MKQTNLTERLKAIAFEFRKAIKDKNFDKVGGMLDTFNMSHDVNELHVALGSTYPCKEHPAVKKPRGRVEKMLEKKLK